MMTILYRSLMGLTAADGVDWDEVDEGEVETLAVDALSDAFDDTFVW